MLRLLVGGTLILRMLFRLRPSLPVQIENSGRACALAQVWATRGGGHEGHLVFVSVSDGVGVGVVVNGEIVRGRHNIAGEFGHVPSALMDHDARAAPRAVGKHMFPTLPLCLVTLAAIKMIRNRFLPRMRLLRLRI